MVPWSGFSQQKIPVIFPWLLFMISTVLRIPHHNPLILKQSLENFPNPVAKNPFHSLYSPTLYWSTPGASWCMCIISSNFVCQAIFPICQKLETSKLCTKTHQVGKGKLFQCLFSEITHQRFGLEEAYRLQKTVQSVASRGSFVLQIHPKQKSKVRSVCFYVCLYGWVCSYNLGQNLWECSVVRSKDTCNFFYLCNGLKAPNSCCKFLPFPPIQCWFLIEQMPRSAPTAKIEWGRGHFQRPFQQFG